jgi:SAM-dependent methyltransferase
MDDTPDSAADPAHGQALTRSLHRSAVLQGSITVPAVPALLDEYVSMCIDTFSAVGVKFDEAQRAHLRGALESQLDIAFAASARSEIVITYDAPFGHVVNYHVSSRWASVATTYDRWVATREPPYFGVEPDARVMAVSSEAADPATCPVLDVGAGVGRNALALARRGHPVDALEMSGEFAQLLRAEAGKQSLSIRVLERDVFTARDHLPRDYQLIVVSEVVSDFRSTEELRAVFELAATCLRPGGHLVVNAFLARDDYQPDDAARQLGQQTYSAIFTRAEMAAATAGLPLELCDETDVLAYEREHLPSEAWPPTSWYEGWVSGRDVLPVEGEPAPIALTWLVYRKTN